MNIQKLNLFSLNNNNKNNNVNITKFSGSANATYPNLRPLAQDTVSFSGGKVPTIVKNKLFTQWDPENPTTVKTVKKICDSFEKPLKDFTWNLKKAMEKLISTESNPDNIILPGTRGVKSRVKAPKGVIRKANKRKIYTVDEINKMGDVGGARIILRTGTQKDTALVFKQLKELVKQGYKVLEVENYRTLSKDSYVSQSTLENFQKFCQNKGQFFPIENKPLKNSYTAVHVSFEVPGGKVIELQIMGRDVEHFKDVEDLFYKYRCNEDFADEYKPIQEKFKEIMPKLDDFQKETLDRYIKDSYEHARHSEPVSAKTKFNPDKEFLPFPYSLPQELNPTNLYRWMQKLKAEKAPAKSK